MLIMVGWSGSDTTHVDSCLSETVPFSDLYFAKSYVDFVIVHVAAIFRHQLVRSIPFRLLVTLIEMMWN